MPEQRSGRNLLDLCEYRSISSSQKQFLREPKPMTSVSDIEYSELYSAYASGALDAAFALLVETQAAIRPDVAREVAVSEAIAGAMLERQTPAPMAADAFDKTLALIDRSDPEILRHQSAAVAGARMLDELTDLPAPLLDHTVNAIADTGWAQPAGGVNRLTLDLGTASEVELYRIEPERSVPRHSHKGSEFSLVVAGGFTDETGAFGPGDLSVKGPEDVHQPIADPGEVCYVLSVRDGGLRLTGMLGLVQRMLGQY